MHRNGSNVQGYFVWSFLDVFEYLFGYRLRFGVDFGSAARTRYRRHSAQWFSSFLRGGELRPPVALLLLRAERSPPPSGPRSLRLAREDGESGKSSVLYEGISNSVHYVVLLCISPFSIPKK
jgi:hypothetical protein